MLRPARALLLSFLALIPCAAGAGGAAGGGDDKLPPKIAFEDLGRDFIAAHCKKDTPAPQCVFDDVLQKDYARFSIGAFDYYYPAAAFAEKSRGEALREILLGVVDFHGRWFDWLAAGGERAEQAKQDVATVRAWIKGWRSSALGTIERKEDKDWIASLKPDPEIAAAVARLREYTLSAEELALVPLEKRVVRIVLCPTRLDFMQLLGYGGLIDDASRANWVDGAGEWTQFWIDWTLCLALQYSPWGGTDPEFKTGDAMTRYGPTVTVQHVVQQSTLALLRNCNPYVTEGNFDRGLAAHAAITVCGELNTIESAGTVYSNGARTQPYSRFVPGGSSSGGTLPPQKADSLNAVIENQWRKGHGKDHFLEPLRDGQKAGAKEAKDRSKDPLAYFLLKVGQGGNKHLVHAPFFGPQAAEQAYPPPEFLIDYSEFFRSYKAAFIYWLEARSEQTPEASKEKFRSLMRALAKRGPETSFDQLAEEVYGLPISAKDGSTDSLEWRFLKWIQSGK